MFAVLLSVALTLEAGFTEPPQANRPQVWWWFDNAAPKESIVKDLAAMKRVGLGGFHFRKFVDDPQVFKFAVRTATDLGLEAVSMVGAGGCGHPGVPPEFSQKELVFTTARVTGGRCVRTKLKRTGVKVKTWNEKNFDLKYFTDLKTYAVPSREGALSVKDVVDVSAYVDGGADLLNWPDAPEGDWTILRFGWVPKQIGWSGNGIDHMSRAALDYHWSKVVTPYLNALDAEERKTFTGVLCDSWEVGVVGWTPGFEEAFRKRRGYVLWPWLPVLAGVAFAEVAEANKFRRDYDLTIADLITENHYRYKLKLAHRDGLKSITEACGPHQEMGDVRRMQGACDIAMGEAWMPCKAKPGPTQRFLVRDAASAAHVYGIPEVLCETFTTIKTYWREGLSDLKPCADRAFCDGMTRVCWHGMQHSGSLTDRPGTIRDIGPHYTPQTTWFEQSRAFNAYLARCSWMLSQGRFVADCLLYAGDAKGIFMGHKEPSQALGEGFDYDLCPTEVLLGARVENGEIVLGSGMRYKVLFVSDIRPEYQLEVEGKCVRGTAGVGRAHDLAGCTAGVGRAHEEGLPDEARAKLAALESMGATVCRTRAELEAFKAKGTLTPDFTAVRASAGEGAARARERLTVEAVDWIHRTVAPTNGLPRRDLYFVVNRTKKPLAFEATFRASGPVTLWDPQTGERYLPCGGTALDLDLPAYGSVFVVFGASAEGLTERPGPREKGRTVKGPWTVAFDPAWGGPNEPVVWTNLTEWTACPEPGIRYYSGTAVYRSSGLAVEPGERTWLDLGRLGEGNVAEVYDGTKRLAVLWTAPYRVEVTAAKDLAVRVTNLWPNRLICDAGLPPERRLTKTNINPYKPTDRPLRSGLLGPVRLEK